MHLLAPIDVTDAVLTATNLPETDHAAWATGTTYAEGQRVIVVSTTLAKPSWEAWTAGQAVYWHATRSRASTVVFSPRMIGRALADAAVGTTTGTVAVHAVYESVAGGNQGVNPVTDDDGSHWVRVGATNRWRAFEAVVSDPSVRAGDMTWTITVPTRCNAVALLRLDALSATVTVRDTGDVVRWTETRNLSSTESIVDWETFVFWDPMAESGAYETQALFAGFVAYPGWTVEISVTGSAPEVGEIVTGDLQRLGISRPGTEVGFEDYSRKTRDEWGNAELIPRDYADLATFQFAIPKHDVARVKRLIVAQRGRAAAWFAEPTTLDRVPLTYGFVSGGLRVPLEAEGYHFATLEIEGLT